MNKNLLTYIKSFLSRNYYNSKGFSTKRKIIVIESDDWGTIRMPSYKVYNKLLSKGIKVEQCPFNKNDTLATPDDLQYLFEVLCTTKDDNGNSPKITANTIVANPDFDKIRKSNFKEYHYELFTETLKKYNSRSNTFEIWQEGIDADIFVPQFHGREHLNISRWLKHLRNNSYETRLAFDNNLFGLSTNISNENRRSFMAAFDYETIDELALNKEIIEDGLKIFKHIFGFFSSSFIATNYVWSDQLNSTLLQNGIGHIQSGIYQILPIAEQGKNKIIRKYMGEKNYQGQIYTIRNCVFEPTISPKLDNVGNCMNQIKTAFLWKKPAIINTHRLNFIGAINEENRNQNLKDFKELLTRIINKWPDVEFLSSNQLVEVIKSK